MINKRIIALLASTVLFCSIILTGCGNKAAKVTGPNTVGIVDCYGEEVQIPENVERIGCLYSFSGHVVAMLGEGEKIVAVSNGLQRDVILTEIVPEIMNAVVPKGSGLVNFEELAKSNPDMVFIDEEYAVNEAVKEKFAKFKIPYLAVKYDNIEEQIFAVNMIAKAIGAEDRARKYEEYYRDCIDRVQSRVKDIPEEERIKVYHSVNEAYRTDSKDTLSADWMEVAGAVNVSVGEELRFSDNKYFANIEQILLWDPDVILVNENGVDEYIMKDSKWKNIKAVKENKVYQLPNGISRWGHPGSLETPLAILWTGKILYPELFEDMDIEAETRKFYSEFFNYNFSDQELDEILSGGWMRRPKK